MATLQDIHRRIRSVGKTQQITSAMRMVSAAKLRRAQDSILVTRPYAQKMYATLIEVGRRQRNGEHALLKEHDRRGTLELVLVTSDRGLCGAFNANAIKRAEAEIRELGSRYDDVVVTTIGRKGTEYFRRRHSLARVWETGASVEYALAEEIAGHLIQRYTGGEIDGAVIVYNQFVSALTQTPRAEPLLPLSPDEELAAGAGEVPPFEIEPDAKSLLDVLVPNALEYTVFWALLENQAGEHAARMTAMESATRNTEELIRSLTLKYNRARQAAITKELVEIVSGAEALA
jgi:F-type H+-transporting ATPase subunit gamma